MPSPFVIQRPSGRFVRFFVPVALQAKLGQRYILRKLPHDLDDARLFMACLAMAISNARAINESGGGIVMSDFITKTIKNLRGRATKEWLAKVVLPNGASVEGEITTESDFEQFNKLVDGIGRVLPESPPRALNAPTGGILLSTAIGSVEPGTGYLGDIVRKNLDKKTVTEFQHTLKTFLGFTGDVEVSNISIEHLRFFIDEIQNYPRNASVRKEYKHLAPLERLALAKKKKEAPIARHTLNKHFSCLNQFLNHLVLLRLLPNNQLSAISLPQSDEEEKTGRPFSDEELKKIFGGEFSDWSAKYPHRYWGVLFGLYSGARVNEIAQLYVEDFESLSRTWGFHIRAKQKDQKIKNEGTERFVPIAQEILDAGFLEFLESAKKKGKRIFMDLPFGNGLGYGRQLSRQFSTYIKRMGVEEKGVGFHAFRHTISTRLHEELAKQGLSSSEIVKRIALITGHDDGDAKSQKTVLESVYIEGLKAKGINQTAVLQAVETLKLWKPPVTIHKQQK